MIVRDALLTAALGRLSDGATISMDQGFQGLPDIAHGGSVLALFDCAASLGGPRVVRASYMKRVPLVTGLRLRRAEVEGATRFDLLDAAGATLVTGEVVGVDADARAVIVPGPASPGSGLPISSSCFVCGVDNPIGLGASFTFDDRAVVGVWTPRDRFRAADGTLAPIALTALLDEGAFWLGALATGESGMTTELAVTFARPLPFGAPLRIIGDRAHVVARTDGRYLDTELVALSDGADVVATARITFVAVRGAARRLASWLARTNPPETIRRVFPSY